MFYVIVVLFGLYSFIIYKREVKRQERLTAYWNSIPAGDLMNYEEPYKTTFTMAFVLNPVSWAFYGIHLLINKVKSEDVDLH